MIRVSDMNMAELDLFVGNKEVKLLRYFEPEPGIFIAESRNVIDIALKEGYEPVSMICTEKMADDEVVKRAGDIPVYIVDPDEAKKTFGYVLTGGISCAMRRKKNRDYREVLKDANRVLVLEDVENPTNVGAIIRSAAALGIDGILLSPACADPLYRRAMRVCVGNSLLVPWAFMEGREEDWKRNGIESIKNEGFTTCAMALREDDIRIDDPRLKKIEKLALVMGNEGEGLCSETIKACDHVAKIPMSRGVDSLNVAVAAGIAMWEICKSEEGE